VKAARTIIVGGPRTGKSWLAAKLANAGPNGVRVYCGDPLSKVKDPEPGVNYLPEWLPFAGDDGAAAWVVNNWFMLPGPWICEGHVMARAIRRWLEYAVTSAPVADRIIVLRNQRPGCNPTKGQVAMHKGVLKVWDEIAYCFPEAEAL
jgi:hypothetical protein